MGEVRLDEFVFVKLAFLRADVCEFLEQECVLVVDSVVVELSQDFPLAVVAHELRLVRRVAVDGFLHLGEHRPVSLDFLRQVWVPSARRKLPGTCSRSLSSTSRYNYLF